MRTLKGPSFRCMRGRRDLIAECASVGIRLHPNCGQQSVASMQNERNGGVYACRSVVWA
jgi:hypothetical protein